MKFGTAFPAQVPGLSGEDAAAFATQAESNGFDSLWVLDRLIYPSLAPLPLLAAAAVLTSRVRLGTCILLAALHSPLVLAKQLATIDQLSGGRLTVGAAIGGREIDYHAAAIPMGTRARRLEESIGLWKQAWAGGPIDFDGQIFSIHAPPMGPAPVQQPHPPVYMGGRSQPALERAVRLADGYIPGGSGPANMAIELDRVHATAEAAGRDPASLPCAAVIYCHLDDDDEQALNTVTGYLTSYYAGELKLMPELDTVFGRSERAADRIHEFMALPLETLILVPTSTNPEQVDRLAEAVHLASS